MQCSATTLRRGRSRLMECAMPVRLRAALVNSALAFSICLSSALSAAQTATYPNRPVRMVVPLAPGGGSDIVGRIVAQALTERWGRAVVVDNRPGAGTVVGTTIVAKAVPDGYTLLVSSSSIVITPALYRGLEFDVTR